MACTPNSTCQIARAVTRYSSRLTPNPFAQAPATVNWDAGNVVSSTRSRKTYRKTPLLEAGTLTRAQLAPTAYVKTQSRPQTTIRRAKSLGANVLNSCVQPTSFYQEAPVTRVVTQRGRKLLGKAPTVYNNTTSPTFQIAPATIRNTGAVSRYTPPTIVQPAVQNFATSANFVQQQAPVSRVVTQRSRKLTGRTPTNYVSSPTVYNSTSPTFQVTSNPQSTVFQAPVENYVSPTVYSQAAPVSYENVGQTYNASPVTIRSPTIRRPTGWGSQTVNRVSPVYTNYQTTQSRVPSTHVRYASGSPSIIPSSTRYSRSSRGVSLAAPRATEYNKDNLPPLPPVNASCCGNLAIPPARSTHENVELGTENRVINLYDNDVKTIVRDVNHHKTFLKTVVTTVNRNHIRTNRVVENHNNHNHYLTKNVIRVNDVHRQRIQRVPGQNKNYDTQRQTLRVEPAVCGGCNNEQ